MRRRARVLGRSLLLHVLVLALVVVGLFARMSESSDVQLALAQRTRALARLDGSAWPASGAGVASPAPARMPLVVPLAHIERLEPPAAEAAHGQPGAPAVRAR